MSRGVISLKGFRGVTALRVCWNKQGRGVTYKVCDRNSASGPAVTASMRYPPEDTDEVMDALNGGAEPWMIEELKRNWDYLSWGPDEDYQWCTSGPGRSVEWQTWSEFETNFTLGKCPTSAVDRYGGEVVGWYFEILGGSLAMVLWIINPRLGQSYGARVSSIEEGEVPRALAVIDGARDRLLSRLEPGACQGERWADRDSLLRLGQGWEAPCSGDLFEQDDLNEVVGLRLQGSTVQAWVLHPRKGASRLVECAAASDVDEYLAEARRRTELRMSTEYR